MQLNEKIRNEIKHAMKDYRDEEIREILKKRNLYNPKVAQMAVEEALRRGIIHSEQDLVAREYKTQKLRFRLFPVIENKEMKERLIKSLSRGILLTGVFPVIFGFLKIAENQWTEAFLFIILGVVWILSTAFLMRTHHRKLVFLILTLAVLSAVYVASLLLQMKPLRFMDLFVAAAIYGIIFYSLFYIHFLRNPSNEP
jgi:4-amino-4-deoxy-L-arabinose transferase-like glycosyltransferase